MKTFIVIFFVIHSRFGQAEPAPAKCQVIWPKQYSMWINPKFLLWRSSPSGFTGPGDVWQCHGAASTEALTVKFCGTLFSCMANQEISGDSIAGPVVYPKDQKPTQLSSDKFKCKFDWDAELAGFKGMIPKIYNPWKSALDGCLAEFNKARERVEKYHKETDTPTATAPPTAEDGAGAGQREE